MNDLRKQILEHSQAFCWVDARMEWDWTGIEDLEEARGQCICGMPIRYEYTIQNRSTGAELIVGSACIKHFENLMSHEALSGGECWKAVQKLPTSQRMNKPLIQMLRRQGIISEADARFCKEKCRTRFGSNRFTDARLAKINLEVLASRDTNRPECLCDRKRYRNHKAQLKESGQRRLFYSCRRGKKGCSFFQWSTPTPKTC